MDFTFRRLEGSSAFDQDQIMGEASISVDSSGLIVSAGTLFSAYIPIGDVTGGVHMPDPRPTIQLPLGLSATPSQWGRHMLCLLSAYDGLVRLDFRRTISTGTPGTSTKTTGDSETIEFDHLLLSLADPDRFLDALNAAKRSARPPR